MYFVENPFSKKIEVAEEKEELSKNWSIFNKIEFDEDGNVIEVKEKKINSQNHELSPIEFDENGWINIIRNHHIYISIDEEDLIEESEEK